MKTTKNLKVNVWNSLSSHELDKKKMSVVLGGTRRRPKSRDKDKFDMNDD